MEQQSKFEGWAVVEMFGHQKIAGYVTTENYGAACLFRVDVPELPEREEALKRSEYTPAGYLPVGTKVKRQAEPAYSKLVGPGAVYALNPCSEEVVRRFVESERKLPLIPLEIPASMRQIEAPDEDDYSEPEESEGDF